ncbi:hypothetical protein C8P66_14811 [Humitalea rosea]|uniref:Pectate lyase-like protein n=1 Tax=Humitalea rosea TaxID=990373 RepID=A0A2W7HVI2_9PROT|nr:hypothetical protein [Humitalea rosea]PZW37001.1 hypothetical protein C8P66_14811 [Humitalea rosea]
MADARLTDLPAAGSLGDADLAPVVQGAGVTAETRRATMLQLRSAMHAERDLHVRDFGAVGNGTTDDVAPIQAAIDAAAAAGGGLVRLGARRYLIAAADLDVKANVTLTGGAVGGQREAASYASAPFALVVDPARTIRMRRGARLDGLAVLRRGLTPPTTVREAFAAVAAFAGTAVTVGSGIGASGGDGADTRIERLLIIGFDRAIVSDYNARVQIRDVLGDNRNGVFMSRAYDIARIHGVHFWPFVTGNLPGISLVSNSIANITSSGGLIRVTTSAAHQLATGDLVNLTAVGGVPNANGRFAVTVISSTVVDLQGSSFAGAFTSGGLLHIWSNRRTGRAFVISDTDVGEMVDCFAYGYDVGFEFGTATQAPQAINCSVDNNNAVVDPVPIGLLIKGTAFRTKWIGGFMSSQGTTVRVETSSAEQHHIVGCVVNGGNQKTLDIASGALTVEACDITAGASITGVGNNCVLNIQDAAQNLTLIGNDMRSATFSAQSDAALQKVTLIGNRSASTAATRIGGGMIEFSTLPSVAAGPTRRMDIASDGVLTLRRRSTSLGARMNFSNIADSATNFIAIGAGPNLAIGGDSGLNPNGGLDLGAAGNATLPFSLQLRRISTTPANGDRLGQLQFNGLNSGAAEVTFARFSAFSDTVTAGAEAGSVSFETRQGSTLTERFRLSASGTLTLGGPLVLAADPAAAMQATTKQYVDGQFTERRLPSVVFAVATAITHAAHNARMLVANSGATLSVDWTATGDGFSCLIFNRTGADLGFTLTGFTSNTAPSNGDGLTRVKAGGIASLFCFSPDGGATKLCHLTGAAAA